MEKVNINDLLESSLMKEIDLYKMFEEKAKEYNMTVNQARELLDIEKKSLNPILKGKAKQPNLITVLKIADFLEIDMSKMISSLLSKQTPENISKLEIANKSSFLGKRFDLDKLYKEKFISTKTDTNIIINRIISFFGFAGISEFEKFEKELEIVLYSQSKRKFTDKMRYFSIASAYRLFQIINNPNEYDRDEFKKVVPKIKPYCMDIENGLYTVCRALFDLGVTVIFQKHLMTAQYYGATFIVNNKPCIVLTDLGKVYPKIWNALLHEIYHVLFDYEAIEKYTYHLTGLSELTLEINENEADEFAGDFFFPKEMYGYIKPHIHSKLLVENFAKKHNIDPSFIYRGFQFYADKEGLNYWKAFHQYFPDIHIATNKLNPMLWEDNKSMPLISESFKKVFKLELTQ